MREVETRVQCFSLEKEVRLKSQRAAPRIGHILAQRDGIFCLGIVTTADIDAAILVAQPIIQIWYIRANGQIFQEIII